MFSSRARAECERFQSRVIEFTGGKSIKKIHVITQIVSFCLCVVEKIEGWQGKINYGDIHFLDDDSNELKKNLAQGKGALLIGSHLGNIDMMRAVAVRDQIGVDRKVPITVVLRANITKVFDKTMSDMTSSINLDGMDFVDTANFSPDTMMKLMDTIERGGLVVITGDRTPADGRGRVIAKKIFGKDAALPYGPFLLAFLLKAPVYFFFALRQKDIMLKPRYDMNVENARVPFDDCPRAEREARIQDLAERFARALEARASERPFQWYNFYDFWR